MCFFVVLSLTHFVKVNAQRSTVISNSLPINSVATVTIIAGSHKAGNANGTGTAASFSFPIVIRTTASSKVFVPDLCNNLIHKLRQEG